MARSVISILSECRITHSSGYRDFEFGKRESHLQSTWVVSSQDGELARIYDWDIMKLFEGLIAEAKEGKIGSISKRGSKGPTVPSLEP